MKELRFIIGVFLLCLCVTMQGAMADEFPPLPLKPKIPDNLQMDTQKYPLKRNKSVRMKLPPDMRYSDLKNLIVPALSNACVHQKFNQIRKSLNYVYFKIPSGGIRKLEAASIGDGNLFDPRKWGLKEMLYLFEGDSTSECRVYSVPYYRN